MKKLFSAESNKNQDAYITKVVEHGTMKNKFKLAYLNRNGHREATIQIFTSNGDLKQIACARDIGLSVDVSYVADFKEKRPEAIKLFCHFESYLKQIYT